jgi:ribosome-binding protein aMBF1 (putative translation factor)
LAIHTDALHRYLLYVDKKAAKHYKLWLPVPLDRPRKIARDLGRVIRRKREGMGLSQEKIAELTEHHRTYIGFLERGERSPNVNTLQRVAKALGMSASDLLRDC